MVGDPGEVPGGEGAKHAALVLAEVDDFVPGRGRGGRAATGSTMGEAGGVGKEGEWWRPPLERHWWW